MEDHGLVTGPCGRLCHDKHVYLPISCIGVSVALAYENLLTDDIN